MRCKYPCPECGEASIKTFYNTKHRYQKRTCKVCGHKFTHYKEDDMATTNDITGDEIKSRANNKAYQDNYDAIFRKQNQPDCSKCIYGFTSCHDKNDKPDACKHAKAN